ncbi:hypothetical protein [Oceanidesulfovibrio indonesiensis]|nr:hypothetical protein [Oceanidesulfovibrio indonesiensis]
MSRWISIRSSRIVILFALFCIACAGASCATLDPFDSDYELKRETWKMENRERLRRTNPAEALKKDIAELKSRITETEKRVEEWDKLAQIAAAPNCDLGDCAEAYARRLDRADFYRDAVAHQKMELREMERKLDQLQRSSDGSSGGGSGGGSGGSH